MALAFGIFRRGTGVQEDLVFQLDEEGTRGRLFGLLMRMLPQEERSKLLRRAKPKVLWNAGEIESAFGKAWRQLRLELKKETVRIP